MASTAWTTPVVNVVSQKKPAYPFHQSNTKSLSLLSKHKHPFLSLPKSSNPPHFFTNTRAFKIQAAASSSSDDASAVTSDAAQELFDWPSVILPYVLLLL
uniref:Uncharacterized protein n=1 Tax=Daucus carota subsp. sativus TaxID=79200 RepID=A0A166DCX5_DAUCS